MEENKKNNKSIIIGVIIFALLGFIFYPWIILPIQNKIQQVLQPIARNFSNSSRNLGNFFSKLASIKNLDSQNQSLLDENLQLKAVVANLEELKHENEILKKEINFINTNSISNLMPAQIVAYSPNSYIKSFKINKGARDGIVKNLPVLSSGFLIGIITEVYENSSDVLFITDSKSLIPVILQESRATGLLQGGLKGLIMNEIPLDSVIKPDETVLTSGLGGDLPSGIPIGKATKIISAESAIFQKVIVESPIKFSNLEIVFVRK